MRKEKVKIFIMGLVLLLSGCSEAVSFNSNVENIDQFTCKSYNAEDYEERALRGSLFECTGEAAIIRGVKMGDSESCYNNAGVIELEADRNYYMNEYLYPEVISRYGGIHRD